LKVAARVNPADKEYLMRLGMALLHQPGVEFVGEVDDFQKQELIGNALALLFPINWEEPFGIVMIEAMACGTPVIAFDRGSVREVITHGANGFICEDVDSAVSCIKELKRISRAQCRHIFEQRFTARRMTQDYLHVFRELLAYRAFGLSSSAFKVAELTPLADELLLKKESDCSDCNPEYSSTSKQNGVNDIVGEDQVDNTMGGDQVVLPDTDLFYTRKIELDRIYSPVFGSIDWRLLGDGWSDPELWGTWTDGDRSTIELGYENDDEDCVEVTLGLMAFICEKKPHLKVTCRINNSKSVDWEFTKETWQSEKSTKVTAQEWNEKRPAELVLEVHEPKSPKELGLSADHRRIGLGLLSIKVSRIASRKTSALASTDSSRSS
jgi:Glycosyltransferase